MRNTPPQRVALVTGASSGIGWASALLLHTEGWKVYGLSRSGQVPEGVHTLRADVTVAAQLRAAVQSLWEDRGSLHLVVHAAGIGGAGPVENYPAREVRKIMDTNFMGAVNLVQACLPYLREQGSGKLMLISSVAGLMGLPFHGIYAASKFAIEGLVESLRLELFGTEIKIVSICPGDTNTPIIGNQYRARPDDLPITYRENYRRADAAMTQSVAEGVPAGQVAEAILQVAEYSEPKARYLVGRRLQRHAPTVKSWLPGRWFERLMAWYYGIEGG
jgi:NAD(P)-dependent dehydrogenase (short-subunit alcohol dehydrogenase family)